MSYNTGTDPTLAELITAKVIPEQFRKDFIMHTKSNLVIGNNVRRDFQKDLQLGYKAWLPVLTEGSMTEVTPGTVPTPVDSAGTVASITVDKWFAIAHEISRMSKIQSGADYLKAAAKSQAYSAAKKLDLALSALFSTLYSSSVYGTDGQEFTADMFSALVENLDEGDVPDDGTRVLIGDSSTRRDIIKNCTEFIRTDYVREPVVPTGKIGRILNVNVFFTNNLTATTTGNYGVIMHPDALGAVTQSDVFSHFDEMPGQFRTLLITEIIYGVAELRDTFGRAFYTRKS